MSIDRESYHQYFGNNEVNKLLQEDGHVVLFETYAQKGDRLVPVTWGAIPENLVSFTLIPKQPYTMVSQILVINPDKTEYERREIPVNEPAYGEMVQAELKEKGYSTVVQHGEDGPLGLHHIIGIRRKIPNAFLQ